MYHHTQAAIPCQVPGLGSRLQSDLMVWTGHLTLCNGTIWYRQLLLDVCTNAIYSAQCGILCYGFHAGSIPFATIIHEGINKLNSNLLTSIYSINSLGDGYVLSEGGVVCAK
jgi:hypothetical protein